MRNISDGFRESLEDDSIILKKCFKIKLKNGTILAFTEFSEDIEFDGITYKSFDVSNKKYSNFSDITTDDTEIIAVIDDDSIKKEFILSNDFDDAEIEIFFVNVEHLEYGSVILTNGFIDSVSIVEDKVYFNIKGKLSLLEKTIGDTYSPLCRAKFCDKKCSLNIANYKFTGEIASVIEDTVFYTDDPIIKSKEKDYFKYGYLKFTNGENIGRTIEIKQSESGNITISASLVKKIKVGDEFDIFVGCDKKFETCCEKFNNAVNFRGEPNLPRTTKVYKFY